MIPASYKLPLRTLPDFFRDSQRFETALFTAYVLPNTIGHIRCSIVLSKKNEKLATRRNALKRQYLPLVASGQFVERNLDIVIRLKKKEQNCEKSSFLIDLGSIIDRMHSSL